MRIHSSGLVYAGIPYMPTYIKYLIDTVGTDVDKGMKLYTILSPIRLASHPDYITSCGHICESPSEIWASHHIMCCACLKGKKLVLLPHLPDKNKNALTETRPEHFDLTSYFSSSS